MHGTLYKAGSAQMHPFDNFERLVDLLRNAIALDESGKPSGSQSME